MNEVQLAAAIAALLIQYGPLAGELWVKMKTILTLSPDEQKNVAKLVDFTLESNASTRQIIDDFRRANNLPPVTGAPTLPAAPATGANAVIQGGVVHQATPGTDTKDAS